MYKNLITLITSFFLLSNSSMGQPFLLKSAGQNKSFSLRIYYGAKGKGAFVQYVGQQGLIPLRAKSVKIDRTDDSVHYTTVYIWDEVLDGKITGSYGLHESLRHIDEPWYLRAKDNKKFRLQYVEDKKPYDGENKFYLHNTLIEFNHFYNDRLAFHYRGNQQVKFKLPEIIQPGGARQSHIADYNFDGYDDVAFSVADAGMGVYQEYTIYLYNPKSQRFSLMPEPNFAKANCSGLCDVSLDAKKKLFYTSCRGGAKWWQDVWQYQQGKLVWLRSEEKKEAQ